MTRSVRLMAASVVGGLVGALAAAGAVAAAASPSGTVPGAPAGLTATATSDSVTLDWTAPSSDGGSAVQGYNVYDSTSPGGEAHNPPANGGADGSALVTGTSYTVTQFEGQPLSAGTTYYFTVTAVNAVGESGPSSEASATPEATAPGAPTNVGATARYQGAAVSWTVPPDNGAGITSFTITPYQGSTAGTPVQVTSSSQLAQGGFDPGDSDVYDMSGLTNATAYSFTVSATNSKGTGPAVSTGTVTPGVTPPAAPTDLVATPETGSVSLSWTAPTYTGDGSALAGYNIYEGTTAGGESGTPLNGSVPYTGTSLTVSGLTNGTTYFFVVKAVNAESMDSSPSNEVSAVPAVVTPGAPTGLTASGGWESATLSWTAPSSSGDSPLAGYEIFDAQGSGATCTPTDTGTFVQAPTTTYTLSGLSPAPGTSYCFAVEAVNGDGHDSPLSNPADASTTNTVPSAPQGLTATTPSTTSVDLSWTAPADPGDPVGPTSYDVFESTGGGSFTSAGSTSGTTDTVTGLQPDTAYSFYVEADNVEGFSPQSNTVTITTGIDAPAAPSSVTASPDGKSGQLVIDWTAPSDQGGSAISKYAIAYSTTSGGEPGGTTVDETPSAVCTLASCSVTLSGFKDGTQYFLTVAGSNSTSSATSSEASATPETVPGAPSGVTGTVEGPTSVSVSWATPASDGGSPVTGYDLTSTDTTTGDAGPSCETSSLSCTLGGLVTGDVYTFTVAALNAVGKGPGSTSGDVTPGPVAPNAPSGLSATTDGTSGLFHLSWTAPSSNGGAPIVGYSVCWGLDSSESSSCQHVVPQYTTVSGTSAIVDLASGGQFSPSDSYYFTVFALNSAGRSPGSNTTVASVQGAPAAPPSANASPDGAGRALVDWTAPSDNGSPITGYTVTPFRNGVAQSPRTVGAAATSTVVSGLSPNAKYYFTVAAENAAGTGPAATSNIVTIARYASRTVLSLSRTSVTYGHEQAELLSVHVSGAGGVPNGLVTVSHTSCRIRLRGGHGSCRLGPKELSVGLHRLVATFHPGGQHAYKVSSSKERTLRVVR